MCGIAGIMTLKGDSPSMTVLQSMGAALRHRGPDGNGHYRSGDVGIVQTRLAIIASTAELSTPPERNMP